MLPLSRKKYQHGREIMRENIILETAVEPVVRLNKMGVGKAQSTAVSRIIESSQC